MKEQFEKTTTNTGQINFKLSPEERQNLEEMAAASELNLSEYCRIKCLMEENTLITQRKRIAELEKEVKTMKVRLSCYKNSEASSEVGEHDIVLKLNEEQKELLNRLYGNFVSECIDDSIDGSINYNILETLLFLPVIETFSQKYYKGVFEGKDYNYWWPIINKAFSDADMIS